MSIFENKEFFPSVLKDKKIMLVEDNEVIRESMVYFLEHIGAIVYCYDSAEEALVALPQTSPSILITDFHLAGIMTGDGLIQNAHRTLKNPPSHYILSSAGDTSKEVHALQQDGIANIAEIHKTGVIEFSTKLLALLKL